MQTKQLKLLGNLKQCLIVGLSRVSASMQVKIEHPHCKQTTKAPNRSVYGARRWQGKDEQGWVGAKAIKELRVAVEGTAPFRSAPIVVGEPSVATLGLLPGLASIRRRTFMGVRRCYCIGWMRPQLVANLLTTLSCGRA